MAHNGPLEGLGNVGASGRRFVSAGSMRSHRPSGTLPDIDTSKISPPPHQAVSVASTPPVLNKASASRGVTPDSPTRHQSSLSHASLEYSPSRSPSKLRGRGTSVSDTWSSMWSKSLANGHAHTKLHYDRITPPGRIARNWRYLLGLALVFLIWLWISRDKALLGLNKARWKKAAPEVPTVAGMTARITTTQSFG